MSGFEEIYRRHCHAVSRYAWRLVGRHDIAEEITADVFLALHQHTDTLEVGQLPGWLFTVARHRAMDYWRRRAVEERYVSSLPGASAVPPADRGLDLLESRILKPVHRLCLRLRYRYGMSLAEIARTTGLSEMQVKGHLQYARQLLRTELTKESG
jgi:RNA polymerase sigma-70 factor (ECF subfamily)